MTADPKIPADAREVYTNERGEPIAYCPKDSIGLTDLQRGEFLSIQDKPRLRELLKRARFKEQNADADGWPQCSVVVIDVDDPSWTWLVDLLMPGHDWQSYRDRGERPIARGVVPRELVANAIADFYPAAGSVPNGKPCVAIFAAGGISLVAEDDLA